jgi:SP family galactose:H+ symporter-like MFS transporter
MRQNQASAAVSLRPSSTSPRSGALAVAYLMVYVGAFAVSLGPIFWLLISEIYPLRVRGLAAGVATPANWASNLLVSLTLVSLLEIVGTSMTF